LTAPISERILDGITRKSLIAIAKKNGLEVKEESVLVSDLVEASKNGSLREIFGAGTAAVVSPIVGFSYKDEYFELPKLENSYAMQLKTKLTAIQNNIDEDSFGWLQKI
jgi:branched-chain amino acid aminotransferase